MERFIFLNWFDIKIGRLFFLKEHFVFQFIQQNIHEAINECCPINTFNVLSKYKTLLYDKKPPKPFEPFLIPDNRIDLIKKFNISNKDNSFDILYKVASKSDLLDKNGFWISI